jgi:hypothetical protein
VRSELCVYTCVCISQYILLGRVRLRKNRRHIELLLSTPVAPNIPSGIHIHVLHCSSSTRMHHAVCYNTVALCCCVCIVAVAVVAAAVVRLARDFAEKCSPRASLTPCMPCEAPCTKHALSTAAAATANSAGTTASSSSSSSSSVLF